MLNFSPVRIWLGTAPVDYAVVSTGWPSKCGNICTKNRCRDTFSCSATSVATGSSCCTGTKTATSSFANAWKRAFFAGQRGEVRIDIGTDRSEQLDYRPASL